MDTLVPIVRRFEPDVMVIEGVAYNPKNTSRAAQLHELTGIVKWEVFKHHTGDIVIVAPTSLKKAATGSGKADKTEMMRVAHERFGIRFFDDNICDAVWLCATYLDRRTQ